MRSQLENVDANNSQQTVRTLLDWARWYRGLLDEELIAAWRKDDRARLAPVMQQLADPRVAAGVIEFSWRSARETTFVPENAELLGMLMERYPESPKPFLDDLLTSPPPGLSPAVAETVCRILLDMPDIGQWKANAKQILGRYRATSDRLIEADLRGSNQERMYRAWQWQQNLGTAPRSTVPPTAPPALRRAAAPAAAAGCVPQPSGLVAWWPGDGNPTDVVGGHNASTVTAVNYVPATVRNGFVFGPQGHLDIPHYGDLENQRFTWIAWVRPDGSGSSALSTIVSQKIDADHAAINLSWRAADQRFTFDSGSNQSDAIVSADPFPPGSFYLVSASYDGATFKLRVNGIIEASLDVSKRIPYSAYGWEIGGGVIDEVQAYNRALTADEVLAIFRAGSAGVCRGGVTQTAPPTTASTPPAPQIYRVGNGVSAPSLLAKVEPEYSELARILHAEGMVVLVCTIQPEGVAADCRVTRSFGYGLDEQAIAAVLKWRFKPGMKDGVAVAVQATIEENFHLLNDGTYWSPGPIQFTAADGVVPPVVRGGTMPGPDRQNMNESVVLDFTVDAGGSVKNINVVSGSPSASALLTKSLATWKFQPARQNNRPVGAMARIVFAKRRDPAAPAAAPPQPSQPRIQRPDGDAPGPPTLRRAPGDATSAVPDLPRSLVSSMDGQRYVWIPSGAFNMGCSPGDSDCATNEKPQHAERVAKGFWIGRTEVTQTAYTRVTGGNPSVNKGDQLPVANVTWNHAVNYCRAIGGRLPTEIEWEYAARAGVEWSRYGPLDDVAWHAGNGDGVTHPVAQKQPNAFGLYDMLGNVWEWVNDSAPGMPNKFLRGGAVYIDTRATRTSTRIAVDPSQTALGIGFRCAADWPEAGETPATASASVQRISAPAGVNMKVLKNDGQNYVWIPAGSFTMGCSDGDADCDANEKPSHAESIAESFWIGQTEVTQAAFQRVKKTNPSAQKGDNLPVTNVTWNEALSYCTAIGGFLPTEAEWEYAARGRGGATPARYTDLDAAASHSGNSSGITHPVGQMQPNAFGVYDILGNAWEWVEDPYSETEAILRGGSATSAASGARASRRSIVLQSSTAPDRGFRCAGNWSASEMTQPAGTAAAAPGQIRPGVYTTGNGVSAPALLRKVEPEYSEEARRAKYEGVAILYVEVGPDGNAGNIKVSRAIGLGLDEQAIAAVRKWKFKPGYKDGQPVTVAVQIEVQFKLF
jgi:TonB family protein